ncbi:uncharacterized protein LOC143431013 [Xylocopa sonorina]|uniref:uncharacterized protein LOC143431013 n=1 Tax=Xylocopa sonorina TaxID=1818115 RepID=UPI00403A97BA
MFQNALLDNLTSVRVRSDGYRRHLFVKRDCRFRDIDQDVLCICYTETYDFLAAGLTDGSLKLYKTSSGEVLTLRDTEMMQKPSPTTAIKHRPVHRSHPITRTFIATYANGCVKCWHYPTAQCLYTIREKRQTLGLAYHSHLPKFVTLGDDAKLVLYDEETKVQERVFHASDSLEVMDGHKSRVFSACFNPKSAHELISGGWDDTIQFWDTRQPYALRRISGVHMCGDGLDISRNGKEILSCSWQRENPIQLWDYRGGRLLVSLEPDSYSSLLYCGKYVSNMFLACGGTDANLFRVVDLRSHAVSFLPNCPLLHVLTFLLQNETNTCRKSTKSTQQLHRQNGPLQTLYNSVESVRWILLKLYLEITEWEGMKVERPEKSFGGCNFLLEKDIDLNFA